MTEHTHNTSSSFVPTIPAAELEKRRERCLSLLGAMQPEAGGLLVFSRVSIYYLAGTLANGVFWLPRNGDPLLLLRKGLDRARQESPDTQAVLFRSFKELAGLAGQHNAPLGQCVAAEQNALPWNMADRLVHALPDMRFVAGDAVLSKARAVKTPWELERMQAAGAAHAKAAEEILPHRMEPGMTELEIARMVSDVFIEQGSCGLTRMNAAGEEMFLGYVSSGENGNYPTFYNGPLGCRGIHPAAPYLGCAHSVWKEGDILTIDAGFCHEGYNSDKTLTYFAGCGDDIPAAAAKAHEVCRRIELMTAEKLRPGAVPAALYEAALAYADEQGFAQGFMGLGQNKVPFLGHGIGLCIDEWPVLARRFAEPLEAGMTLAIEPKIGLPGIGMVGTENTWQVSEDGGLCLSGSVADIICVF